MNRLSLKLMSLLVFAVLFVGCEDNFDIDESGEPLFKEKVFSDFNYTSRFLTNLYSHLPNGLNDCEKRNFAVASGDATTIYPNEGVNDFHNGNWTADNVKNDVWAHYYKAIRQCNIFLEEIPGLTFENIKYNIDYERKMKSFSYYGFEARFLRAFYYFELIKRYGGVPLVKKPLTREEANTVTRASFSEVMDFIVAELDDIKDKLPADYSEVIGNPTGRITQGAAYAFRARALLYAASPLWNTANDATKWGDAAAACNDILLLNRYDITDEYKANFNTLQNSELIFERRLGMGNDFERSSFPIGKFYGEGNNLPSQNLVDSYEMQETGLAISDPASGYNAANPYEGRDPRFYASIFFNQTKLHGKVIETFEGGDQGFDLEKGSKTGYYLRKLVREDVTLYPTSTTTQRHVFPLFRYAEVILNYAEAMNEAYGPLDNHGYAYSALEAVSYLRTKRGMPAFAADLSKDEFRSKLRNERRVELAFENHRFFDIRRWKAGKEEKIMGMKVRKVGENWSYEPYVIRTNLWNDKYYLFPISNKELLINSNLDQNEGW